jgi:geranylgeranyl pyrophosphate synthase
MEEMILKFNMTHWEELITMLESAGSIEYAKHLINSHLDRALTILEEFPNTQARSLISEITQYVRERHD